MTPLWTSAAIAAATGGEARGDFALSGMAIDSREVRPGWGFIALRGEQTDGHRFLSNAFAQGAHGAIVSDATALDQPHRPHVLVADTAAALDALGRAARARTQARIIGVTGSAGKTGVKEAIRLALERFRPGEVHASVKSYNNHVGVPLSLSRMPAAMRFGVFEMGMNHSGELAHLTRIVRPHIAIVTTVASAHRAFFATEEDIADAKGEIFLGLEPGGVAILNFDNPHYRRLRAAAEQAGAGRIMSFSSQSSAADVHAVRVVAQADSTTISARVDGENLMFKVGLAGHHWVSNALGVLAVIRAAGADLALAGLALAEMQGLEGRGARHVVALDEDGGFLLIDESYNANPASMAASLQVLGGLQPARRGRRIAVLGDMRELGSQSHALHAGLAEPLVDAGVAVAILVGPEMAPLAKTLGSGMEVLHCADAVSAEKVVRSVLRADDVVLVKGSNGVRLGQVVAALTRGA